METGRISAGVEPAAPVPARERTGEAPAGVPVLGADAAWRLLLAVRAAVDAECGPGELAFTVAGKEVRPGADGAATVVVDRRARHVARGLERFGPPARELLELFLAQAVTPREAGFSVAILGQIWTASSPPARATRATSAAAPRWSTCTGPARSATR